MVTVATSAVRMPRSTSRAGDVTPMTPSPERPSRKSRALSARPYSDWRKPSGPRPAVMSSMAPGIAWISSVVWLTSAGMTAHASRPTTASAAMDTRGPPCRWARACAPGSRPRAGGRWRTGWR